MTTQLSLFDRPRQAPTVRRLQHGSYKERGPEQAKGAFTTNAAPE